MPREFNLRHLHLREKREEVFQSPKVGVKKQKYPARNREQHAQKLRAELEILRRKTEENLKNYLEKKNNLITISGKAGYDLKSDSAKSKRADIEVLVTGKDEQESQFAVLRMPLKGFNTILQKVEKYRSEIDKKSGKPKNKDFIEGIEKISESLLEELWMGSNEQWPADESQKIWWEIWLCGGSLEPKDAEIKLDKFRSLARKEEIEILENEVIRFTERQVLLVKSNVKQLRKLIASDDTIAEIHSPSRAIIHYFAEKGGVPYSPEDILEYAKGSPSPETRVAIIDTGISDKHPLLVPMIAPDGLHTIDPTSPSTADYDGHGTEVAGIAAYGDLAETIANPKELEINHTIESIRIKLDKEGIEMHLWGDRTREAIEVAENSYRTEGIKRVFNLSIGADKPGGKQTSWSAAIDQLCYNNGKGRLMTIAAGNVDKPDDTYPYMNLATEIDDPSQALNAICVGGITHLVEPIPETSHKVIAFEGELSPLSCCGLTKHPIKPDVVWEAGNVLWDGSIGDTYYRGLSLLTTNNQYIDKFLINTSGTSMAAPNIARVVALIWAANPNYKPATIRGLLVHSAGWTDSMKAQFKVKVDCLRAFGYGKPSVELAKRSAKSAVTLIDENSFRCSYKKENREVREMAYYKIPWPQEELLQLGEIPVELRVTLSYFIEPNPRQSAYKYEGTRLAWEMQGTGEPDDDFFKRINKLRREEGEKGFKSKIGWEIGFQLRSRGTVQSDRWRCTAADLASCQHIAVFPINGWWKDNPQKRPDPKLDYSLIISVITKDEEIDLYNPIEALITIPVTT
jgi:hypothetical protein